MRFLKRSVSGLSLLGLVGLSMMLMSGRKNTPAPAAVSAISIHKAGNSTGPAARPSKPTWREQAMEVYETIDLAQYGLSEKAFEYAWKGYQYLLRRGLIQRKQILSIADFSQSSRNKRLYIIDVEEKKVLLNTYVAHGRNSGGEYARSFSNRPESHKSSLGFYITRNTYIGQHGLSLKIQGVEKGINDRALARNIVIHGSDYVGDEFIEANPFNGRSFGCPAVPAPEIQEVIETIKQGSCLFIYHPTKLYIQKSRILG